MKKLLLLFVAMAVLASCQQPASPTCHVRFENLTDYTLFYGVKFGDAQYIGSVPPGFLSNYYVTTPGTYSLQAANSSGQWLTISNGALTVSDGHYYTIVGTGTSGTYYWNVVQDS